MKGCGSSRWTVRCIQDDLHKQPAVLKDELDVQGGLRGSTWVAGWVAGWRFNNASVRCVCVVTLAEHPAGIW
jgi:hypothetical protein